MSIESDIQERWAEFLSGIQERSRAIQIGLVEKLQELAAPLAARLSQGLSVSEQLSNALQEAYDKYQPILGDWEGFFVAAFKQKGITPDKLELLGSYGWTMPMSISLKTFMEMLDSISDFASAETVFANYYVAVPDNFETLANSLLSSSYLIEWKPLLEEAIMDYRDGRYRTCTAALLPLIDGVTAITFTVHNFYKPTPRKEFFENKLQTIRSGSLEDFMWRSFKGFVDMLFQASDFTDPNAKPNVLNRHWLLHGRSIPDASRNDCLRLMQALDTVAGFL